VSPSRTISTQNVPTGQDPVGGPDLAFKPSQTYPQNIRRFGKMDTYNGRPKSKDDLTYVAGHIPSVLDGW